MCVWMDGVVGWLVDLRGSSLSPGWLVGRLVCRLVGWSVMEREWGRGEAVTSNRTVVVMSYTGRVSLKHVGE